ncbi:hypothetical protein EON73_00395 [bacterium]|nr:MAG: hypothetical protein EON73_00395 [bacterium]
MNKILVLFLIILPDLLFGQSTANLDVKNGFRQFKFGNTPSQIRNIIRQKNQFSKNPNVVEYDYVGSDINNIFNVKVDKTSLSFFKNKLFNISVTFGDIKESRQFELYDFDNILSALELTYGTKWLKPSNDDGVITNGAIWDGKFTRLELFRIDFSKSKTNPKDDNFISGYINVFDKKLTHEMFSSNF